MKNLNRALVALAVCIGTAAAANTAQAFHIRIDCWSNDGWPTASAASTTNAIEVAVQINGGAWQHLYTFSNGIGSSFCDGEDEVLIYGHLYTDASDVTAVRIRTNGSNLFWVDEVALLQTDGSYYAWSSPAEGGDGACLSTQASDLDASYCEIGASGVTFHTWYP